jgi:hypothetical protein
VQKETKSIVIHRYDYIENWIWFTKKLIELINEISNVVGHTDNIKKIKFRLAEWLKW